MEIISIAALIVAAISVLRAFLVIRRAKTQIAEMAAALSDVKAGNGNRRILAAEHELAAPLAYEINEVIVSYENRLAAFHQMEETNKQAHDKPFP